MALTDDNMVMQVAPVNGGGNGFGFGDGNGWWILLLFILLGNGAWGMGGFGGADGLYPWLNNSQNINGGFRDQMLNTSINGIQSGVTGIQTQLCNGFAGVNATVQNGFAQAEIAANARQMADMNQRFALQSQLADCCCENRLATCQTQNIVQSEGSATRFAEANNTRDIIDSQTRGTQAILDKLCALELDGVKAQLAQAERENVGLQNQLNMASFRESQAAQNSLITQGFSNEVDALYNRLKNCPVPSMPVYGTTPIFTCGGNSPAGCGCGCGNF